MTELEQKVADAKAAVDAMSKASNAVVQEKGPGVVAFIKSYWYVGVALLAGLTYGALVAKGVL